MSAYSRLYDRAFNADDARPLLALVAPDRGGCGGHRRGCASILMETVGSVLVGLEPAEAIDLADRLNRCATVAEQREILTARALAA